MDPSILDEEFTMELPQSSAYANTVKLPAGAERALEELKNSAIPKSTAYQQKRWSEKFKEVLQRNSISIDFHSMKKCDIAKSIEFFYLHLRKKKNKYYAPSSLKCVRAALYWYFISTVNYPQSIDIINDKEFHNANLALKGLAKKFLKTEEW